MSDEFSNPWTTKQSEVVFTNPWIHIVKNDVINPSGGDGEYTVVHFQNRAVAVIPIDEEGYTWLVGQFRYAHGQYEWELPEGGAPKTESLLDCAKRELLEETGLVAKRWDTLFSDIQLSNSVTDEVAYCFVARDLTEHTACPEDTEQLQLKRLPLTEAIQMARNGDIRDALSILSLLQIERFLNFEECGPEQ